MNRSFKVKILSTPKMKYGGQIESGYSLDLANTYQGKGGPDEAGELGPISKGLSPVSEEDANIEAERGETIYGDFDGDGVNEHMDVLGKKHVDGGTPLAVPGNSRIFSDTKKLKIKDPNILKMFGKNSKSNTKKGITPAQIAKQYDINKYKAILDNPNSDNLSKNTAKLMMENMDSKLNDLFMIQEASKGFPQGVPPRYSRGGTVPKYGPGGTSYYANPNSFSDWYRNQKSFYGDLAVDHYGPEMNSNNVLAAQTMMANNDPEATIHAYRTGLLDLNNAAKINGKMPNVEDMSDDDILKQHMDSYFVKDKAMFYKKNFPNKQEYENFIKSNNLSRGPNNYYTDNKKGNPSYYRLENDSFYQGYYPDRIQPQDDNLGVVTTDGSVVNSQQNNNNSPIEGKSRNNKGHWWKQDKINTFAAAMNLAGIKKYLPYEPTVNLQAPDFTFLSPERELAANSEQAYIQSQMAAQYAGGQRLRSVGSSIQGQAAANAGNIISKYSNENIQLANQASNILASVANQNMTMNAQRSKNLYDGNTRANARYDQERMMGLNELRNQVVNGITNSQKTQWLCEMYPQYCTDNNGYVNFTKGKPLTGVSSNTTSNNGINYLSVYESLKKQYPNATDEALRAAVQQQLGIGKSYDTNADGIPDQSSASSMNQMMSILSGMRG